jgi:hypothetical protein
LFKEMGKDKKKRGKRGGRQAFLKALKKELHSVGVFDPDTAFLTPPLSALLPPGEIAPYPPPPCTTMSEYTQEAAAG